MLVIDFASSGAAIATDSNQCTGQGVVWRDLSPNKVEVTNNTSVPCHVIFAVYNTFGKKDLSEGDQYLMVPATTDTIAPHSTKNLVVSEYNASCFVQIDVIVGWKRGVLNPLTYNSQYGTEYLARHVNHPAEGPALTRGSYVCKKEKEATPTPTRPAYTATPTWTATVVPTYTPTSVATNVPTSTPVPTQTTVVSTPTQQPTQVPTSTTTVATPSKSQPTVSPPSKGPTAPSTGSGLFGQDYTKDFLIVGCLLGIAGLCLFGSYYIWSVGNRNRY